MEHRKHREQISYDFVTTSATRGTVETTPSSAATSGTRASPASTVTASRRYASRSSSFPPSTFPNPAPTKQNSMSHWSPRQTTTRRGSMRVSYQCWGGVGGSGARRRGRPWWRRRRRPRGRRWRRRAGPPASARRARRGGGGGSLRAAGPRTPSAQRRRLVSRMNPAGDWEHKRWEEWSKEGRGR